MSRHDVITLLYIVAFSLFIAGLHMLRGPRTAVRGNQVAAVGMAIAVIATLLNDDVGDWVLIVVGVAIGTAIGIPAARNVLSLIELMTGEEGALELNFEYEVIKGACVARDGERVER